MHSIDSPSRVIFIIIITKLYFFSVIINVFSLITLMISFYEKQNSNQSIFYRIFDSMANTPFTQATVKIGHDTLLFYGCNWMFNNSNPSYVCVTGGDILVSHTTP